MRSGIILLSAAGACEGGCATASSGGPPPPLWVQNPANAPGIYTAATRANDSLPAPTPALPTSTLAWLLQSRRRWSASTRSRCRVRVSHKALSESRAAPAERHTRAAMRDDVATDDIRVTDEVAVLGTTFRGLAGGLCHSCVKGVVPGGSARYCVRTTCECAVRASTDGGIADEGGRAWTAGPPILGARSGPTLAQTSERLSALRCKVLGARGANVWRLQGGRAGDRLASFSPARPSKLR
jgi:hypothetical protein